MATVALSNVGSFQLKTCELFGNSLNHSYTLPFQNRSLYMKPLVIQATSRADSRTESAKLRNRRIREKIPDEIEEVVCDKPPKVALPTQLDSTAPFDVKKIAVRARVAVAQNGEFLKCLAELGLRERFERSCFGHFLNMPNGIFANKIVHCMLLRRVFCQKENEMWFNFFGMPLRFGFQEFCLMSGLRGNEIPNKKAYQDEVLEREKAQTLLKNVTAGGTLSRTRDTMLAYLKNKEFKDMDEKFGIALVYFYMVVLFGKHKDTSIDKWVIGLAAFPEEFQKYAWGREVYDKTLESLKVPFTERHNPQAYTIYGFPHVFMAWAYEAIPALRRSYKFQETKTLPRMFRWMVRQYELNPSQVFEKLEAPIEVRPMLVPTPLEEKVVMNGFVPYEDKQDEVIDGIVAQLKGVTMLRLCEGVAAPEEEQKESEKVVYVERPYEGNADISEVQCTCLCVHCKRMQKKVLQQLECMGRDIKWLQLRLARNKTEQEVLEYFMLEKNEEKTPHFQGKLYNFRDLGELMQMNDQHVDDILSLMRLRQKKHPEIYSDNDLILDRMFLEHIHQIYLDMEEAAGMYLQRVEDFVKDAEPSKLWKKLVGYPKGEKPYPGGRPWEGIKRVFAVHKVKDRYYVGVVIHLDEGSIDVYDSTLEPRLELVTPLLMGSMLLIPKFLKDCAPSVELPQSVKELQKWKCAVVEGSPKSNIGTASGEFALAIIDRLLTNSQVDDICDNTLVDLRAKWAAAIYRRKLEQ